MTDCLEIETMSDRPNAWHQVINVESETCYWLAPDGSKHPGTEDENRAVRDQLLEMRTISDKRRTDQSESR